MLEEKEVPASAVIPADTLPSGKTVRINPRTGKPITMPKPLSLSPHDMSPIQTEADVPAGSQMIREEHEEVSP